MFVYIWSEQPIGIVVTLKSCLNLHLTNQQLTCVGATNESQLQLGGLGLQKFIIVVVKCEHVNYGWLRLRLSTAAAETFYGWLRLMNSTAAYGGGSGA